MPKSGKATDESPRSSNAGNKRKLRCISFGYLFFVQAKKSNSPKGEKKHPQKPPIIRVGIHAHPTTHASIITKLTLPSPRFQSPPECQLVAGHAGFTKASRYAVAGQGLPLLGLTPDSLHPISPNYFHSSSNHTPPFILPPPVLESRVIS